jgi:putative redox protein
MIPKAHISLIKSENLSPHLYTTSKVRGFEINSDEPENHGGENRAPAPFDLLNAALSSCTSIYLRIQAGISKIDIGTVLVKIKITRNTDKSFHFDRKITFKNNIKEEYKLFLLEKANLTPVTLVLKKGNTINTVIS